MSGFPSVARLELSKQGLHNLRTLAFGSLDAKAVADAFRKLDLRGMPVRKSPCSNGR